MTTNFFAVDLGATSGRTILATFDGTRVQMQEITRFANPMIPLGGHLYWDIAGLGTIMGPVLLNVFFPEMNALQSLTAAVLIGVGVTLLGIAIIGIAGGMKSASLSEEEKKEAVKDFNFPKGLAIALLAGFMSGCFNVGLEFGKDLNFGELTNPMFRTLPIELVAMTHCRKFMEKDVATKLLWSMIPETKAFCPRGLG